MELVTVVTTFSAFIFVNSVIRSSKLISLRKSESMIIRGGWVKRLLRIYVHLTFMSFFDKELALHLLTIIIIIIIRKFLIRIWPRFSKSTIHETSAASSNLNVSTNSVVVFVNSFAVNCRVYHLKTSTVCKLAKYYFLIVFNF